MEKLESFEDFTARTKKFYKKLNLKPPEGDNFYRAEYRMYKLRLEGK